MVFETDSMRPFYDSARSTPIPVTNVYTPAWLAPAGSASARSPLKSGFGYHLRHMDSKQRTAGGPRSNGLPRITVATVVPDGGRFLFVEERVRNRLVLNQPAGHLEPGESLTDAAVRETQEETGWRIRIESLIAIYHWPEPPDRKPVLRFTFLGRALDHDPDQELDTGIERALWLSRSDLDHDRHQMRSPLVRRSLEDYLAGQQAPLTLLASIPNCVELPIDDG